MVMLLIEPSRDGTPPTGRRYDLAFCTFAAEEGKAEGGREVRMREMPGFISDVSPHVVQDKKGIQVQWLHLKKMTSNP